MKSRKDAREKRVVGVARASWIVVSAALSALGAVACGGGEEADDGSDAHETGGSGSTSTLGYCDVAPIIEAKCLRCHGEPQENGAPFPLTSYEMLIAESPHGSGTPLYERMSEAITTDFMPATWMELDPPVEDLTQHEEATLVEWFEAHAPAGDVPCK